MLIQVNKEIFPTDDSSVINIRQKLFPEEEKMPLAKYFYKYPLHYPTPVEMKVIKTLNTMDPKDAIQPENFMSLLNP